MADAATHLNNHVQQASGQSRDGEGSGDGASVEELTQLVAQLQEEVRGQERQRGQAPGFDPVQFLRRTTERLRDDLQTARQQLQEAQRENHQLRAEQFQKVTEAKEEVRSEMSATVAELRRERDHAERERDRAQEKLERKEYEDELRAKFEREFGPKEEKGAGGQIMELISSIAGEHGGEYVRQVLEIIKAQANGGAGNAAQIAGQAARRAQAEQQQQPSGDGQQQAAQNRAALQQALTQIESHQGDGGATLESPPGAPAPNQTPDQPQSSKKQMPHHQRVAANEQPTASNASAPPAPSKPQEEEGDASEGTLTDQFAETLAKRTFAALDAGESAEAFAADARQEIARLQAQGFQYTPAAFAQLTERIVQRVGGTAPTERVAELLAPFLTDLPAGVLQGVKMLPAGKIKSGFIDAEGVDLSGHDDYLIDVLRELKSYL